MASTLPRVPSTASELNDFTETNEGKKFYHVSKSRLVSLINLVEVYRAFLPFVSLTLIAILVVQIAVLLYQHQFDLLVFFNREIATIELSKPFAFDLSWQSIALLAVVFWYLTHRDNVYLIDFTTFDAPDDWKLSYEQLVEAMKLQGCYTEDSLTFMEKMLKNSGTGPKTAWPPGIVQCLKGIPADFSTESSRNEAEIIMFDLVDRLLKQTKIHPKKIDCLIINCSLFSPTPSLCSMVVNKFQMRSDICAYNLSGMGCSAGLISVELGKNFLAGRPHAKVLIISTEIITPNLYLGNERSFLLQNTLFRCGGAAVILSNSWKDAFSAQFKLLHVLRTHHIAEDSFGCVYETEDELHQRGVRLSKDIVKVAGRAMEKNLTAMGPYVLPLSEQLKTGLPMLLRYLSKTLGIKSLKVAPYIPDFKRGIDHFCIHAGGRGVIDGIEKNLNLHPQHVEASRHTLYHYGNTSSSSIWYELKYNCENMNMQSGQRVLQLAFGSGFKCNSAVWLCLNNKKAKKTSSSKTSAATADDHAKAE